MNVEEQKLYVECFGRGLLVALTIGLLVLLVGSALGVVP